MFHVLFLIELIIVSAGKNTLLSRSEGSVAYNFYRKMEMARPARKKMHGKLYISARVGSFSVDNVIKVPFPTLYHDLASKQLCFRQGKGIHRGKESTRKGNFNITLIISWLFRLQQVVYLKESHILLYTQFDW